MIKVWQKTHWFTGKEATLEQRHFYMNWEQMKWRCTRKSQDAYHNYWWRWIKNEWVCFEDFKKDMWLSYQSHAKEYWTFNTTLDRIDVDWNYCKENCKRATRKEQWSNKRNTIHIIINWEDYTSSRLANEIWIDVHMARNRIIQYNKWNMSIDDVFTKGKIKMGKRNRTITVINWEEYTSSKLAKMCWISRQAATDRLLNYRRWKMNIDAVLHIWDARGINKLKVTEVKSD